MKTVDEQEIEFGEECYLVRENTLLIGKLFRVKNESYIAFVASYGSPYRLTMKEEQVSQYIYKQKEYFKLNKIIYALQFMIKEELENRAKGLKTNDIRIEISKLANEGFILKQQIKNNEVNHNDRTQRFREGHSYKFDS